MKTIHLAALVAAPFIFSGCKQSELRGDVSFARSTFESLARGDTAVQDKIDWETLNSMGVSVGSQYIKIPSETEKEEFRRAFITQFSSSFRDNGGSVDSFTNWRVGYHDSQRTDVSADSPKGVLTITVTTRDSVERISALNSTE